MLMLMTASSVHLVSAQGSPIIPESSKTVAVADAAFPSDVANVKAVGKDKMITLSWDASTDNVAVTGYKIFYGTQSVSESSASYTQGPVDAGNVLTYDIKNLEAGKTYYFAVTAYDAAGNESEFYSNEASAAPIASLTPAASEDKVAPKVISASAISSSTVKVVFSEAIKLPDTKPESAFTVKEDLAGTALVVTQAALDATDVTNRTVTLTTAAQKKAAKYVLTVGIQLQDLAGNPMVSGTSDTAVFIGSDAAPSTEIKPAAPETTTIAPAADTTAPAFVAVKAIDGNTVEITFSEPVVLLTNAAQNFIVTDAVDNTKITNITKVTVAQNGAKVTLTTDNMEAKKYNLIALKVQDAAGNLMPVENSATTFDGMAPAIVTPPVSTKVAEAASNLMAKAMANLMAELTWKNNSSKMADVASFVLYMSTDRGATYDAGVVLGKDAVKYDFNNLTADMVYYFKLTTRDSKGNESDGLVTYLTLPKTGPELLFLLLFGSAGGSALINRKKKNGIRK
jgi:hypothetical protein